MFNWKMAAAAFATLALIAVLLASSPQMSGFIDSLGYRVSNILPEQKIERNVSFAANSGIVDLNGSAKDVAIYLQTGNFTAQLRDMGVASAGRVEIEGFSGILSVNGKRLSIDGTFKKISTENTTLTLSQGPIKSSVEFSRLELRNFALGELVLPGGDITIGSVNTHADSSIRLQNPLGTFVFSDRLQVSGNSSRISIPQEKISAG